MSNEVKKIYLCKPNLVPICYLNGVQTDSVSMNKHVKDFDQLTFTVDRYVNINGEMVESNGYELLNVAMYLHVQDYGYFRMEYPSLSNDGTSESKDITAYSIEKEVFNTDWVGLKINTAEEDSQEMLIDGNVTGYAMPINLISFHNPYDKRFSLLHILISKIPLWDVGYVDPHIYLKTDDNGDFIQSTKKSPEGLDVPQTFSYSGTRWVFTDEGEFEQETGSWTEPKYELKSVGIYDEDNVSAYAFLTSTLGPKVGALFFFDTEHRLIHAVSKYTLEQEDSKFDTGIYVGFRNLANSVGLSVDEDSVVTRVNCEGGEGLNFLDLNYGSTRLYNLSYFAHEPYMTEETAQKVLDWQQMIQDARAEYKEYASQAIDINDQYTEITYKVPSDDNYWLQWDGMNEQALNKSLAYYENEIAILQESVDNSPQYDSNGKYIPYNQGKTDEWYTTRLAAEHNGYGGYGTYYETVHYIIPNIRIALNNLNITSDDPRHQEYVKQVSYDWELYGIVELEAQIKNLQNQYDALKDYYGEQWPDAETPEGVALMAAHAWNKEFYNKQRESYISLYNAVGPNGSVYPYLDNLYRRRDGTDRFGNKISDQAVANSLTGQLQAVMAKMAPFKEYYVLQNWFNEEDLAQIYPLLIDTDYSNSNIAIQETDTAASRIDLEQELLDDCIDKVSELSQPQITFTSELDNLYRIEEFKDLRKDLKLLNYIHLGVRDDYVVKLRVVGISWNPCDIDEKLTLEFSNMITSRSGRTDFTDIINSENNRGQKNSITIGANGQISGSGDSIDYLTNLMQALAGTGIFKKAVKNTVTNPVNGIASNVTEDEFMFAMKSVPGISRFVLDAVRATNLEDEDTIIQGGNVKTGFINARYLAVKEITSSTYVPPHDSVYSTAGTGINLETGAIAAPNFAIDASGNAYFKGNVTATSGKIAGWTIDGNKLYNSTYILDAGGNTTTTLNKTSRSNLVLSIGSNFGVNNTGIMYASNAVLSGTFVSPEIKNAEGDDWTFQIDTNGKITSRDKATDPSSVTTISAGNITTNSITVNGGSLTIGSTFSVTNQGELTSTSASIGGWNVDSDSIYYGTKGNSANNNDITLMSSNVFKRTVNGAERSNLKFAIGSNFAVDNTGKVYASNVNITGSITASTIQNAASNWTFQVSPSGTITSKNVASGATYTTTIGGGNITTNNINITGGQLNIGNGTFKVTTGGALTATSATITGTITSSNATITGGSLRVGNNFNVGTDGKLTASSASISGAITATSGRIAGWTIDGNRLYNNTYILNAGGDTTTTIDGKSRGSLVLSIGSNFGVNTSGTLYANGVVISGTIDATSITAKNSYKIHATKNGSEIEVGAIVYDPNDVNNVDDGKGRITLGDSNSYLFTSNEVWINNQIVFTAYNGVTGIVANHGITIAGTVQCSNISAQSKESYFADLTAVGISCKSVSVNSGSIKLSVTGDISSSTLNTGVIATSGDISSGATVTGASLRTTNPGEAQTSTPNCRITKNADGTISGYIKLLGASSIRYKNIIREMTDEDVEAAFSIPTFYFKYKEDYIAKTDERYNKPIPGFIAEEVDSIMPIAVDHIGNNKAEVWNNQIITPIMFQMIKSNRSNIDSTRSEIEVLKDMISEFENRIKELTENN